MSDDEFPDLPTISDIFSRLELADGSSLDKKSVAKLIKLKKEDNKPLFTVDDTELIMNTYSMIDQLGFDETLSYLKSVREEEENNIIKKSPIFLQVRKNNFMELTKNIVIKQVTASHTKCVRCGKRNVTVNVVQLRSSDEGASELYKCNDCKHEWRIG